MHFPDHGEAVRVLGLAADAERGKTTTDSRDLDCAVREFGPFFFVASGPLSWVRGGSHALVIGGPLACPVGPLALPARLPDEWAGGMSGNVFTADEILVAVSFDAARCQLEHLARDGGLLGAAEYAYGAGITGLGETAGPAVRMSRLAGVRAEDLAETPDGARLGLRWEAIGPDGAVYPVLDAALTLASAGETATLLALAGFYHLPGEAVAGMDPAFVRCFAAVAVRSFIARIACTLMHPAGVTIR